MHLFRLFYLGFEGPQGQGAKKNRLGSRFFFSGRMKFNPLTNRVCAQSAGFVYGFSRPSDGTGATSEP